MDMPMSMWYKGKPTSSGLYLYETWTLLTKIVVGGFFFASFLFALTISCIALSAASHSQANAAAAAAAATTTTTADAAQPPPPQRPSLFIQLGDVEGLDPCASPPASPALQLIVGTGRIPPGYKHCSGGGNSMLRVSHRGVILAWGHVPCFYVEGEEGGGGVDGVVTVEARADDAVLREEVRWSVRNDLCIEGKARFTVEGEVAGLGYLRCETSLFHANTTDHMAEEPCPCLVQ